MTQLQALAISSRLASSGYWFSRKKLGGGADRQPIRAQPRLPRRENRGLAGDERVPASPPASLGGGGGGALREDCVIPPDYSEC